MRDVAQDAGFKPFIISEDMCWYASLNWSPDCLKAYDAVTGRALRADQSAGVTFGNCEIRIDALLFFRRLVKTAGRLSAAFIGFLFAAFGVARIFSNATVHRYVKYGEKRVLFLASLSIFAGVITLAVFPSFVTFLAGMMLIGGSFGVVLPIMISFV